MAEKNVSSPKKKSTQTSKSTVGKAKPSVTLWELKKEIDERAHQIYLDRIAAHTEGDELSDWLRAETEVKKKYKLA